MRLTILSFVLGFSVSSFAVTISASDLCEALAQAAPKADASAVVAHLIGTKLDFANQRERLERLTGERPLKNGKYLSERGSSSGRKAARSELMRELRALGYAPTLEKFDGGANIVATIRGATEPRDVIEVTAHFDSVGNPGADDNGSGLSLVMELARLMKQYPPGRTVRFVLMDLEEVGFQGSQHHAAVVRANSSRENLLGVLVLDTIAWAPAEPDMQLVVMEVGSREMARNRSQYDARVKFARMLLYQMNRMRGRDGTLQVSVETGGSFPRTADHGPYWMNGLPAVLVGEAFEDGLITPMYHTQDDRTRTLNWSFYESVSRLMAEMLAFAAKARLTSDVESDDLAQALNREDRTVSGALAWPPAALERTPFLPPWVEGPKEKDPEHEAARGVLDRAFVLGDLTEGAGIVVGGERVWLVGEKTGVLDISEMSSAAKNEIAAEVAEFGGVIWALADEPSDASLKRLRSDILGGADPSMAVQVRGDLPARYFDVDAFEDVDWVERGTSFEKLRKVLSDPDRDSVLVLARRREDGQEVLRGGLAVRHFNSVQWTEVGPLTWEEARDLRMLVGRRRLPPILIFTGADFSEGWRHWCLARVWTPEARENLHRTDRFTSEF